MKSSLTLIDRFKRSLEKIPISTRNNVNRNGGLDERKLLDLILNPQDYRVDCPEHPSDDIVKIDDDIETSHKIGEQIIDSGSVAYCIMTCSTNIQGTQDPTLGALTRIPDLGMSLLTLKIFQAIGTGPIWIMTVPSSRQRIIEHVQSQIGFDHNRIKFVDQYESYLLDPDNQISFIDGRPSLHSCGRGDLFPALVFSGVLNEFIENGGKYISVVDVGNVAGFLDPQAVGRHITSNASVSCEVVEASLEDSGGYLCDVCGSNQIVEDFRILGTDHKKFKWLNTNSIIFNADLNIAPLGKTWHRVQKNVNGKLVVQHKRLLQEITTAYDTIYFGVTKSERFVLVKNTNDLSDVAALITANTRLI